MAAYPSPHHDNALRIIATCEKHWQQHRYNCSGFVRAVADDLGVFPHVHGLANDIYQQLKQLKSRWEILGSLIPQFTVPLTEEENIKRRAEELQIEAGNAAAQGKFVVAASFNPHGHGHVAIIVDARKAGVMGPLVRTRAFAYWGNLPGTFEWKLISAVAPREVFSLGVDTKFTPAPALPQPFEAPAPTFSRDPAPWGFRIGGGEQKQPVSHAWKGSALAHDVVFAAHRI
jgi:hypothetical protein